MGPDNHEEGDENNKKKLVLIIDDDYLIASEFVTIFSAYKESLDLDVAHDAAEALEKIGARPDKRRPDALLIDIMMPYGSAHDTLLKGGHDLDETETGLHLLEYLRHKEKKDGLAPMWLAIVTGRSPFVIGAMIDELIAGYGKVYYKPISTFRLECDLTNAIGVDCKVPDALI